MAETAAVIEEDEEFFLAPEEAAPNAPSPCPRTPLPPDVMEELQQITHKLMKFKQKKNPEIEDSLQLFINEWRSQTEVEIEDLKKLKDRVSIRKAQRAEEDARLAEMRQEEEELRIQMAEEERIRKQEEKIKRIQDAELKRQKMMEEQSKGRNFKIASTVKDQANEQQQATNKELTKEEYDAMKEAALSVIIKPLEIGGLRKERLKRRAQDLWDKVVKLETERYDLEEKRTRQDYDFKELKERQKQQLRQKALKLGLDPEALTGKYPPKIRVASKYERRKGLRPFGETKGLFEGGFIQEYNQRVDGEWQKRQEVFTKRNPEELPPWLADMPRQIIKQIEEEEAAIKAVISKEEVEGKAQAAEDENAEGAEEKTEGGEGEEEEEVEEEEEEEEEEVSEVAEEDGVEKKEIVITEKGADEAEEDEAASVAATAETGAEDIEEVEEEEEEEVEEEEEEASEATPQQPSPAQQQEEELVEEEEGEEEESVEVVPQDEEEEEEEEEEEA